MSQSTQTPPTRPKRRIPPLGWVGIALIAFIIWGVAATQGGDNTASSSSVSTNAVATGTSPATIAAPEPTTPEADASTQLSCGHFRNVMRDVAGGLLTEAELREKTKQFYDTGQRSGVDSVRNATRQMLAAITTGDGDGYLAAAKRMGSACNKVGQ